MVIRRNFNKTLDNHILVEHSSSLPHIQPTMTYLARSETIGKVETDLLSQHTGAGY